MAINLERVPDDIPHEVLRHCEGWAASNRKFCSWLTLYENQIVERVFAYKRPAHKDCMITEVIRRCTGYTNPIIRNLYWSGNVVYPVFKRKTIKSGWYGYNYEKFNANDLNVWQEYLYDTGLNVPTYLLNPQMLADTPFRYSGYAFPDT